MTRTDNCDSGFRQELNAAAHEQNDGRIVDFFQAQRIFGVAERMILAPISAALAHSCCASSSDLPVAIDCADTACIPVASSSVKLAVSRRPGLPKCSTNFFARVGPRPWVRESTSRDVAAREFSVAEAVVDIFADASWCGQNASMMALTPVLLEFVKR